MASPTLVPFGAVDLLPRHGITALTPGMYLYRLVTGGRAATRKTLVVR